MVGEAISQMLVELGPVQTLNFSCTEPNSYSSQLKLINSDVEPNVSNQKRPSTGEDLWSAGLVWIQHGGKRVLCKLRAFCARY